MNNNITISPIGSRVSQWGEGPIFWNDHLLYVDIEGHTLIRLNPESGDEEFWEMGERIGTVVPRVEGGFLCAGDSGIYTFDPITGEKVNVADPEADKRPDNRFNDGKCDHLGRFWLSGIRNESTGINSSIFIFFNNRSCLVKERNNIFLGNGLGWDKNNKLFYFTDSKKKIIFSYQYSNDPVDIDTRKSVFFELNNCNHEPDGLCVDKNGYVWSCIWNRHCMVSFS